MKVAIYLRVACADQLALDNQLHSVQEYADTCGHTTVAVIAENGVSGLRNDKGIASIMHLAKERQIDAVLCSEPSRLSRDYARLYHIQTALRDLGVRMLCLPPYEQNEPEDDAMDEFLRTLCKRI